jgi:ketopantoate reductase
MQWGAFIPKSAVATPLEEQLTKNPFFGFEAEITPLAWRKWLYNTVLNTLTAAYHLACNRDVLQHESEMKSVFAEAVRLGEELFGPWKDSTESLYAGLLALIHATANNENSMARDSRLGLPTESRYLAGMAEFAKGSYPRLMDLHRRISGTY